MGAWDPGSFDNDDALDRVAELEAEGLPAAGGALAWTAGEAPRPLSF